MAFNHIGIKLMIGKWKWKLLCKYVYQYEYVRRTHLLSRGISQFRVSVIPNKIPRQHLLNHTANKDKALLGPTCHCSEYKTQEYQQIVNCGHRQQRSNQENMGLTFGRQILLAGPKVIPFYVNSIFVDIILKIITGNTAESDRSWLGSSILI